MTQATSIGQLTVIRFRNGFGSWEHKANFDTTRYGMESCPRFNLTTIKKWAREQGADSLEVITKTAQRNKSVVYRF